MDAKILKFDDIDISGTSLQGYFESPFNFEETIARLVAISGQRNFENIDDKVWFEFTGTFDGVRFTIYDYYRSERFHVGGPAWTGSGGERALDVEGLGDALRSVLRATDPVSFKGLFGYGFTAKVRS